VRAEIDLQWLAGTLRAGVRAKPYCAFGAMKSESSSLGFTTTPSMVILTSLLDPLRSRFEDISKHKPVYVLVVAKNKSQSAASYDPCRGTLDFALQEGLRINPKAPHLTTPHG
jgi:hypothetical protein